MELTINQPVKLGFTSQNLTLGKTSFTPVILLDGISHTITPTPTYTEIGGGVYTMNFTPTSTGELTIFIEGQIQVRAQVVTKTVSSVLKDLSDEALGSWSWNKSTGVLTLYKSDSSVLATYNVVDTVTTASRERVS